MTRQESQVGSLKIRDVDAAMRKKLKIIATENGYSSVQKFVLSQLETIIATKDVKNLDIVQREREAVMLETIRANSKVLEETNKYLGAIYGVED